MSNGVLTVPGLAETDPQEAAALADKTAKERAWYAGYAIFRTNANVLAAARRGELERVTADSNVALTARLRNDKLNHHYPPYLLAHSRLWVGAVGRLWRRELGYAGLNNPALRLSITSMARSDEAQQELVAQGRLAEKDSTHRTGAAFDLDASGYYLAEPGGGYLSVVHPDRSRAGMEKIAKILRAEGGRPYPTRVADTPYDARISQALLNITDRLHSAGYINRIVEFAGTPNQALHIAPNPEVAIPSAAA